MAKHKIKLCLFFPIVLTFALAKDERSQIKTVTYTLLNISQ